jgi:hypothetical protein
MAATPHNVPDLPHGCGSWIIVRRGTLESVAEIFTRAIVERVNFNAYEALPASDYLARLNASLN